MGTPLATLMTVACSLADRACKQITVVAHASFQIAMAQEAFLGINVCVLCATLTPHLAVNKLSLQS